MRACHGAALAAAFAAAADAAVSFRSASEASQALARDEPKPTMGIGETLRSMMCWSKENLVEHEKCMKYMIDLCAEKVSGHDVCADMKDYVRKLCEAGGEDSAAACDYGDKMGLEMDAAVKVDKEWWKKGGKKEEKAAKDGAVPPGLAKEGDDLEPAGGAPSPAAAAAAAAPAPAAVTTLPPHDEVILDKGVPEEGLPDQGFSGHSEDLVLHEDQQSATADWGAEWPRSSESEEATKERICKKYPTSEWCRTYFAAHPHRHAHHHHKSNSPRGTAAGAAVAAVAALSLLLCGQLAL